MISKMQYQNEGSVLIIQMPEEIDHHSSRDLCEESESRIAKGGIRRIVFDFSQTDFMDSSGIGAVLGRYKRMKTVGGDVAVCGVNERVNRILKMSGIYQVIPCYGSRSQAVHLETRPEE